MKATIKIERDVEINSILIDIAPRHIGDGENDDVPTSTPMLDGQNWRAKVMVDSGQIVGWPGGSHRLQCKVCDAGVYTLYDENGAVIVTKDGYVPNGIVPGEHGDYIDLQINDDGVIVNWPKRPDISAFFEDE